LVSFIISYQYQYREIRAKHGRKPNTEYGEVLLEEYKREDSEGRQEIAAEKDEKEGDAETSREVQVLYGPSTRNPPNDLG
jgi:hypothetical protein